MKRGPRRLFFNFLQITWMDYKWDIIFLHQWIFMVNACTFLLVTMWGHARWTTLDTICKGTRSTFASNCMSIIIPKYSKTISFILLSIIYSVDLKHIIDFSNWTIICDAIIHWNMCLEVRIWIFYYFSCVVHIRATFNFVTRAFWGKVKL